MKVTLSILKADVGSVGGHICPSAEFMESVRKTVKEDGKGIIIDSFVSHNGDDVAILATHQQGINSEKIHKIAWDAFLAGTKTAKAQGLYGAGQDLLKDSFSGNVKGMGPAVAEMEFEERPDEPFLFFAADKTDPGAYSLPLYLAFADPMYNSGLLLSPKMTKGFKFTIMDVEHSDADKVIELNAPEDLYLIAALLRDGERFVVESIHSRDTGDQAAVVSTTRLHNIAGKYIGKDDPVMLVRIEGAFPNSEEVLFSFIAERTLVMKRARRSRLIPVTSDKTLQVEGPSAVRCLKFWLEEGKLTKPLDVFNDAFWGDIRQRIFMEYLQHWKELFAA